MSHPINATIQDVSSKSWSFTTVSSLKEFLENEISFWQENKQDIPQPHAYFTQNNYLNTALNTIKGWDGQIDSWTPQQLQQNVSTLQQNNLNRFPGYWLWSGHPYVATWIEVCKISNNTGTAFIEAILKNTSSQVNNYEYLKGYLLAYEFQMQGKSEMTQRQTSEEKSYKILRNRLDKKTSEVIDKAEEYEDSINQYQEETETYTQKAKRVNIKLLRRTQRKREKEFAEYMKQAKVRMGELENTYQEQLRLKKPAEYWKKQATSFKTQGLIWSGILTIVLLAGIWEFSQFFTDWLTAKELKLELNNLQGAVLFGTVLTIYVFLIRYVSKLVFSSFHLRRDAEEREQLTYVYLSLINEGVDIDKESKNIILQALFSRAETGLLHKDSSPTMPVTELMKAARGH